MGLRREMRKVRRKMGEQMKTERQTEEDGGRRRPAVVWSDSITACGGRRGEGGRATDG